MMRLLVGIALLTSLGACDESLPDFQWLQKEGAFGVPLLKISYPNGEHDIAILRNYNLLPMVPSERAGDVDQCIYRGFLEKENSLITLTGCPYTGDYEVQFDSQHLNKNMFKVEAGKVASVILDSINMPEPESRIQYGCDNANENRKNTLSKNGYIMRLKLVYDLTWQAKWKENKFNAMRRTLAHSQHSMLWPSLYTKIYYSVDPEVIFANEELSPDLSISSYSSKYATDVKFHSYVFFTSIASGTSSRVPSARLTTGKGKLGGACNKDPSIHAAIAGYLKSDITFANTISHELGHVLGMEHDFCGESSNVRVDSQGKSCTFIGAMMSYETSHENDKSKWSTCSVEDFNRVVQKNPTCFEEVDPKNPPNDWPQSLLTSDVCDLHTIEGNIIGYHTLKFNGQSCMVVCIDGICAPDTSNCKGKGNTACQKICGKDKCEA